MEDRDEKGRFVVGSKKPEGSGRQKGAFSINDELRKMLNKKIKDVDPIIVAELTKKNPEFAKEYGDKKAYEIWAKMIIRQAIKGDAAHSIQLWQQLEGKPAQNVNLGGQDDNPIKINIEHVRPKPEDG
jgi:hypothetical protein